MSAPTSWNADALVQALRAAPARGERGRVVQAVGTTLLASGLRARVGQQCLIHGQWMEPLRAEVVGLRDGHAILMPLATLQGVSTDASVDVVADAPQVVFGPALLGRVLDSDGVPLTGDPLPPGLPTRPLDARAPNPMHRRPVAEVFETGVRAIDGPLTVGVGQRLGVFAMAGGGKSTLLSMLARNAACDVCVIGLIGERGREVREFVEDTLGPGLARSVVVVATSDSPAMQRLRAAQAATAIAEGFRAQGQRVLLLMDSVTRYARALREIGLSAGEPAVRRGFPPSVFAELPRLLERTGNDEKGSITAFYTVLAEDEDGSDPVAEEVRSILDGHVVLSSELGEAGHYPAIDLLRSKSRVFTRLASPQQQAQVMRLRSWLARHKEVRFLLQVGEYQPGSDPLADEAIATWPRIEAFLRQAPEARSPWSETLDRLSFKP